MKCAVCPICRSENHTARSVHECPSVDRIVPVSPWEAEIRFNNGLAPRRIQMPGGKGRGPEIQNRTANG